MSKPIRIAVLADGKQARRELRGVAGETSRLGAVAGKAGRAVVVGLAVAGAGAVKLGIDSVRSAKASQQSLGATESVYKRYADTVIRRSERAGQAVGLSANEYRELANVTGAMLKNSGKPLREVTDLTAKLTRRSADLAATYGGTTKEAIESVNSLLRGEADPIERYGVSIKQSDVNARLAAKGLDKLEGSAKKQAEAQARLELLFRQTSDAAGQFRREQNTLDGQNQRTKAGYENLKTSIGKNLLPALTSGSKLINSQVLPQLTRLSDKYLPRVSKGFSEWAESVDLKKVAAQVKGLRDGVDLEALTGGLRDLVTIGREAGPSLQASLGDGARVAGVGLGFLADNADLLAKAMPFLVAGFAAVKAAQVANSVVGRNSLAGFAIQTTATVAQARANRQLAQSLREVGAAQGTATTTATAQAGSISRVGLAARGAAGAAGLGALTLGATNSNRAVSTLASVGGGALAGFAAGGPIGAAIGAGAGLLTSLATNARNAGDAAGEADSRWRTYASTLDEVTGATSRATSAMAFQQLAEDGVLTKLNALGISNRQAVGAVLGRAGASTQVAAALRTEQAGVDALKASLEQQRKAYVDGVNAGGAASPVKEKQLDQLRREVTDRQAVIDKVRSETGAVEQAVANRRRESAAVADYTGKLKGLPRSLRTEIRQEGVEPSLAAIARLTRQYKLQPKEIRTLIKATGADVTVRQVEGVNTKLKSTGKIKGDVGAWAKGVVAGINQARRSGEKGTSDLARLLLQGTRRAKADLGPFQRTTTAGVNAAKGPAGAAATSLGWQIAGGAEAGIRSRAGAVAVQAAAMVRNAIAAARREAQTRSPSRKTRKLGNQLGDGLAIGMRERRGKAKREAEALVKTLTNKLDDARSKYRDLFENRASYATGIADMVRGTGNIVELAKDETGTTTLQRLLDQLTAKADAADRFRTIVTSLADQKLSQANVDQLLQQGPDAALATAEAIAAGGAAAISQLNALTARLGSTATSLGTEMGDRYYKAGVDAALGFVRGFESQLKKAEAVAEKLADKATKKTKRKLKSKSPSRVFEQIGRDTVKGFAIGLEDTTATRQAGNLADSIVKGFGTPPLDAYIRQTYEPAPPAPVMTDQRVTSTPAPSEAMSQVHAELVGLRADLAKAHREDQRQRAQAPEEMGRVFGAEINGAASNARRSARARGSKW